MKIAIDGPSGAGKSTVAKMLAEKLNMVYIDTGAMYRAVALKALSCGAEFSEDGIKPILSNTNIDIRHCDGMQRIYLDGEDVSQEIRRHIMSKMASEVSAIPAVRLFLVKIQRDLAAKRDSILDGRDIGTYVLPDADFKFYLTAGVDRRAERRHKELLEKGESCELSQIKADIQQRDFKDMNRDFAPLKKADDAIEIDSSDMTAQQVADYMTNVIRGKGK